MFDRSKRAAATAAVDREISSMFYYFNFDLSAVPGTIYSGSGDPSIPPRFISRGNTFKVVLGDTVTLPCEVQNLGKCNSVSAPLCLSLWRNT